MSSIPPAIVARLEERNRFVLNRTGRRVGEKSFGAVARLDATVSATIAARLLRDNEDDDAGVPRRIARLPFRPTSTAADLARHVGDVALPTLGSVTTTISPPDLARTSSMMRSMVFAFAAGMTFAKSLT
jgi:hypothetical protein